jgi:hypothetical protein
MDANRESLWLVMSDLKQRLILCWFEGFEMLFAAHWSETFKLIQGNRQIGRNWYDVTPPSKHMPYFNRS